MPILVPMLTRGVPAENDRMERFQSQGPTIRGRGIRTTGQEQGKARPPQNKLLTQELVPPTTEGPTLAI